MDGYAVKVLSDRYLETGTDLMPTGRILELPEERSFLRGRLFGEEEIDMTVVFPGSDSFSPVAEVRCTDSNVVMMV